MLLIIFNKVPAVVKTTVLCVVLYGSVWFCMVLCGSVWFCVVLYGSVWFCMVPYGSVWFCMVLCEYHAQYLRA